MSAVVRTARSAHPGHGRKTSIRPSLMDVLRRRAAVSTCDGKVNSLRLRPYLDAVPPLDRRSPLLRSAGTGSAWEGVSPMNVTSPSARATGAARTIRVNDAKAARGFTLVELSVVVTIVGILAVLAVVGYRKLVNSSHLTEATGIVNGIRVAQESYHAETGYYANISNGAPINWTGGTSGCPAGAGTPGHGTQKYGWNPACGGGADGPFQNLPLHIDTAVQYGYATTSNHSNGSTFASTIPNNPSGTPVATVTAAPTGDWYAVSAVGNPGGDGTTQSAVFGNSISNQLIVQGDGN